MPDNTFLCTEFLTEEVNDLHKYLLEVLNKDTEKVTEAMILNTVILPETIFS